MTGDTKRRHTALKSKTITKYVRDLSDLDVSKRRAAAEALAEADERAVYPLLNALKDDNPGVQDAAMRALTAMGGEVVAYMVLPLLREDSYLRNTATIILEDLGGVSVPLIYPLLRDKDDDVRKFSLDLLGNIREGVLADMILPLFSDPNANVRAAAANAAGALACSAAVPFLVEALKDEEWVSFSALEALGRLRAESAETPISGLLSEVSEATRYAAIETLGKIGSPASSRRLLEHASRTEGAEKTETIKSLVQIGLAPSMSGVLEVLIQLLREGDWEERSIAIKGLVDLKDPRAVHPLVDTAGSLDQSVPEEEEYFFIIKEAVKSLGCEDELIGTLSDPSIKFRGRAFAAEVLGEMKCQKAVPHLRKLLETYFRDVRRAGMKALKDLDAEGSRETMLEAVEDRDGHIRRMAATALGRIGGGAAADSLMKLLGEERHMDVIEEAVKALLQIDPERLYSRLGELSPRVRERVGMFAEDAYILMRLSRDEDVEVKTSAIARMGVVRDKRVCGRLKEATREEQAAVRKAAVMAMGELDCCASDIKSLLSDNDMWVRLYAVKALSRVTDAGKLKALEPMLRDGDIPVVLSTVDAIADIGGAEAFGILDSLRNHTDPAVSDKAGQALENE
jgi:HEAT repeat protein